MYTYIYIFIFFFPLSFLAKVIFLYNFLIKSVVRVRHFIAFPKYAINEKHYRDRNLEMESLHDKAP